MGQRRLVVSSTFDKGQQGVNARYRWKISRMVRQMLNQEEKKRRQTQMGMGEFEKKKERAEGYLKVSNLASNKCTTLNRGGNLLPGPGHGSQHVEQKCSGLQQRPRRQQWFPEPGLAQPRSVHVNVV